MSEQRANYATRAVATVNLVGFPEQLPVELKVYKKCKKMSGIGLERHQYHNTDMGKVKRIAICEDCGAQILPEEIVSLVDANGNLYDIDPEEELEFWGEDDRLLVKSFITLEKFGEYIGNGTLFPLSAYEVAGADAMAEIQLARISKVLKDGSLCAVVQLPMSKQLRKGLLFPNLVLYTLFYENEIRQDRPKLIPGGPKIKTEEVVNIFNKVKTKVKGISKIKPLFSVEDVMRRIEGREIGH